MSDRSSNILQPGSGREAPITIDSDSEVEGTFGSHYQRPVQQPQPVIVEGSPLKVLKGKNFRLVVLACLRV